MQNPKTTSLELGNVMEPEPIAFTFDTLGWKVLLALFVILCVYGLYRLYLKYRHNQYRRDAIAELEHVMSDSQLSEVAFITKYVFVLKRTALQSYPREQVASLKGDSWLQFLDNKVSDVTFHKYKQEVLDAVYKETFNSNNFNKNDFHQMSLKWIKHHA